MPRPNPLHALVGYAVTLYLVTHGISLPAESQGRPGELALGLYYASLAWSEAQASALGSALTALSTGPWLAWSHGPLPHIALAALAVSGI